MPDYQQKNFSYGYKEQPRQPLRASQKDRSESERDNEPICGLKIELDGQHVEEIRVFRNDEPNELV